MAAEMGSVPVTSTTARISLVLSYHISSVLLLVRDVWQWAWVPFNWISTFRFESVYSICLVIAFVPDIGVPYTCRLHMLALAITYRGQ
jgi:hypothetical protein